MKVLLYDTENSPNTSYTWGTWQQDVIKVVVPRQVISIAWKWLGENEIHVLALPDFPGYKRDKTSNKALMTAFHKIVSQADVVIGQNVDEFDDRMINADFIKHNLPPPPPHRTIDTLKVARSKFRFNSNSLGSLGEFLGQGKKVKHWGFELWERCMAGDPKAWAMMKKYNKGDVALLEKIYLVLRPWMTNHPNLSALDDRPACPVCRADKRQMVITKWRMVGSGRKPQFRCRSCGKYSTGKPPKDKAGEWKFN